jgi:hypothetical protein
MKALSPKKKEAKSNTKLEWEKILNNRSSKKLLSSSWNTSHPVKTFSDNVKKILKSHSGKKNKTKAKTKDK